MGPLGPCRQQTLARRSFGGKPSWRLNGNNKLRPRLLAGGLLNTPLKAFLSASNQGYCIPAA